MIESCRTGTEEMRMPIGELGGGREAEALMRANFMKSPDTCSEPQPPTTTPNIFLAYRSRFNGIPRRLTREEEREDEQHSIVELAREIAKSLQNLLDCTYQDITSSFYSALDLDLRVLEQHYIFRNRPDVINFAVDNSFLLQPLHEACEQIRNYFGESAQAVLEVVTDPEFAEDQELVIFIRTNLSPDEAFENLERMDDEWWLDVPVNVRKKLCINVEFE